MLLVKVEPHSATGIELIKKHRFIAIPLASIKKDHPIEGVPKAMCIRNYSCLSIMKQT